MKPLNNLKKQKITIWDNIIMVILLSFGISFIVDALTSMIENTSVMFLSLGLFCILFVIIIKILKFYTSRKHQIYTNSLFIVDNKAQLGHVPRYFLMKNLSEYLFQFAMKTKLLKSVGKSLLRKKIMNRKKNMYLMILSILEKSLKKKLQNILKMRKYVSLLMN